MSGKCRATRTALQQMLAAAHEDSLHEVCGLLGGAGDIITTVFAASNVLASATAYEIAPLEIFKLIREIQSQSLEFIGIYHSHPNTDNTPSPTDIERAYYPYSAYFIISPKLDAPKPVRAFHIRDGVVTELIIEEVV